jgi:hypothetical protein
MEETGGTEYDVKNFRRAYDEIGWVHGEDDNELERIVLGQIVPETGIETFLTNFGEEQAGKIRLYNKDGDLIYDCGTVTEGLYDSDKLIGTGWKLELVASNGTIADLVYLSVLGDIDGDGYVTTNDSSLINSYAVGGASSVFANVEVRLAGYVKNNGYITTLDSSIINSIAVSDITGITKYYYIPEGE